VLAVAHFVLDQVNGRTDGRTKRDLGSGREIGGYDADHFALSIQKGPPAVPLVGAQTQLNEVAVQPADDSG
jgi:hypothetical protein